MKNGCCHLANLSISLHDKYCQSCGCHSLCLSDRFRQLWVTVKDCHSAGCFSVFHLYNSLLFKKNKEMTCQSSFSPNCFNSTFMLQGILVFFCLVFVVVVVVVVLFCFYFIIIIIIIFFFFCKRKAYLQVLGTWEVTVSVI